jgi:hypothetical protein
MADVEIEGAMTWHTHDCMFFLMTWHMPHQWYSTK